MELVSKIKEWLNNKLVNDWKDWPKWWSAQWMMIAGLVNWFPAEVLLKLSLYVPLDIQRLIPGREYIFGFCFALAFFLRAIEQPKLKNQKEKNVKSQ